MTRSTKKTETTEAPEFSTDWQVIGGLRVRRKSDGRVQLQTTDGRPSVAMTAEEFAALASF